MKTRHAVAVAQFERETMTNEEIIKHYYGHQTGATLQKLAAMTGHTIAQLCRILFD